MRVPLFFLLLSISFVSKAQTDFCLPGATWVYNDLYPLPAYQFERKVVYVGDTTITPYQTVRILADYHWQRTIEDTYESRSTDYFAQENDSVFKLVDNQWEFVFDFSVDVGDERLIFIGGELCSSYDTILIESIDTMVFQGEGLRRFNYRLLIDDQLVFDLNQNDYIYSWTPTTGSYLEKVGNLYHSPLGEEVICLIGPHTEHFPMLLTCYTDNEILQNGGQPCSLELSAPSIQEEPQVEAFLSNNQLQIQNTPKSTLRVYDTLGKELFQGRITSDNQSFDISHLPNGILMVVVETETGRLTKKVVKTSL